MVGTICYFSDVETHIEHLRVVEGIDEDGTVHIVEIEDKTSQGGFFEEVFAERDWANDK